MFFRDPDPSFLEKPSEDLFAAIPTSLQFEVEFCKTEYLMAVYDLKFVPTQYASSVDRQLVSYINRSLCPQKNDDYTNDELGENIQFDVNYNIGSPISNDVISTFQDLCRSNYCKVKGGKDFDSLRDDVQWRNFFESDTFNYFILLQATVDYVHQDVRYAKTLIPNAEISSDLKFLLGLANNEDYEDKSFNLAKDTKLLAEALTRLKNFSRHSEAKLVSFGMLVYLRKFVSDFVESERDKIRKILSFTRSEGRLMFRRKDDLTRVEIDERRQLLENHRKLRSQAINSHR
jgi:hypothetical protein